MKIGIIIPDRGDRPEFLENCLRMIKNQTVQPLVIKTMSYKPLSDKCDITQRYRLGYHIFSSYTYNMPEREVDVIAFMENDDWYSSSYLEYMANEWDKAGRPDLFGTNYTIYYHLKEKAYFTMRHSERASAMNTFIKPGLNFKWCPDHEPFTDLHLWTMVDGLTKVIIEPSHIIAVGMKHGMTMTGGRSHVDRLHRYINPDHDLYWLRNTVDEESFNFYRSLSERLNNAG